LKPASIEKAYGNMMHTTPNIAAAKRKNIEAYNRLVSEHQDLIYNFAFYILCDEPAAAKATQQAILRAFERFDHYKGDSLRLWLLHNLIKVCQRRHHKNPGQLEKFSKLVVPFASLPTELRTTLVLVDVEGLNYQQAAKLMGVSTGKVARLLAKARRQLFEK
jgi:RNA polymerase sigma-70 factor, ECF subfamily